jgi:hypothetical protein
MLASKRQCAKAAVLRAKLAAYLVTKMRLISCSFLPSVVAYSMSTPYTMKLCEEQPNAATEQNQVIVSALAA